MADQSLYDEVRQLLDSAAERAPMAAAILNRSPYGANDQDIVDLVRVASAQREALLRIARQVDKLSSTAG